MLQEHVKLFAENLLEAIIITRIENREIVYANNAALNLLGYSSNEIIGLFIFDLVSEEELSKAREAVLKNKAEPYEIDILPKVGNPIPVRTSGSILDGIDENFRITNIVDLRKVKEAERLLFLQSKHAAMGELINMIAHQWRQPLSTISTSISGLQVKNEYNLVEDGEIDKVANQILDTTNFLSKTIEDFRNFNSKDKSFEDVKTSNIVDNALYLIDTGITTCNVSIEKTYRNIGLIKTIKNELLQAILTIFKNSLDVFISQKIVDPKISISIFEDNNFQYITISDNAGGIPIDIIDRIFEPYFTTKHSSQGTGLGLYMARSIVEDHCKGKIDVKNLETGAEFKISLPKEKKGN
ncbi:MAG: PAS domain-containing sensor histidine kinase [Patescibacteria group bacterium]|nr:PAS domain-containing sensor histidine kinase [Patescibacteria group bacterium]